MLQNDNFFSSSPGEKTRGGGLQRFSEEVPASTMTAGYNICLYSGNPQLFLELLGRLDDAPADQVSFPLLARYYEAYFGSSYGGDISFILHKENLPVGFVRAQVIDNVVTDNGGFVEPFVASKDVDSKELFVYLLKLLENHPELQSINIIEINRGGVVSQLGRHLLSKKASPQLGLMAIADLTQDESILKRDLRKSYRSLINWGNRSLTFEYITANSFSAEKFDSFRDFHIQIAGRETRSQETWAIQGELIRSGRAELILSYYEGRGLVGGAFFQDTGKTTVYGVGVYERELFDKPIGHSSLYQGMLRAKSRGQKSFLLGEISASGDGSEKEFSIGQFKSGFTSNLLCSTKWVFKL
jgi:FemAB family protein